MKRILFIAVILLLAGTVAWTQESLVTFSGGYAFANLSESETNATGWRINGLYEFNPQGGKLAHGISFGFISTAATASAEDAEYNLHTWPLYYAPKIMFGKDKFKAFVKGAMGLHFSNYKRTGSAGEVDFNDTGFFGGASAGVMIFIKENIFINAEYEWAFMSNSDIQNVMMNSAMGGLGIRF